MIAAPSVVHRDWVARGPSSPFDVRARILVPSGRRDVEVGRAFRVEGEQRVRREEDQRAVAGPVGITGIHLPWGELADVTTEGVDDEDAGLCPIRRLHFAHAKRPGDVHRETSARSGPGPASSHVPRPTGPNRC